MATGVKLALGAVAAAVAVTAFWFANTPPPGELAVAAAPLTAPPAVTAASPAADAPVAQVADRHEVPAPMPAASAPAMAILRGRCVDEQGRPVSGVSVELRDPAQEVSTTEDGRFEFQLAPPSSVEMTLMAKTIVPVFARFTDVVAGATKDLGDVVLHAGATVRGRVVDTHGTPVAGRLLRIYPEADKAEPFQQLTGKKPVTNGDGTFSYTWRAVPGDYRFVVEHELIVTGAQLTIPVGTAVVDHDIVITPHAELETVTGIVVDTDGNPIADVDCTGIGFRVRTDTKGRFEGVRGADDAPEGLRTLRLNKDGYEPFAFSGQPGAEGEHAPIPWGTRDRRFVMHAAAALQVRVIDARGEAVTDYAIRAFPKPGSTTHYRSTDFEVRSEGHHDQGIARISGLLRGPTVVFVEPARDDLAVSTFVGVELGAGPTPELLIRLEPSRNRVARLQLPDGTRVVGSRLRLVDPLGLRFDLRTPYRSMPDWMTLTGPDKLLLLQEATTDARGEVRLHGPSQRPLGLFLLGPGHRPQLVRDLVLDGEPLVITVSPGARLVGHAHPAELVRDIRKRAGLPEEGLLEFQRRPGTVNRLPGFRLVRGKERYPDASDMASIPDADGNFCIDGADAGSWQLWLTTYDAETRITDSDAVATVTLRDGETTAVHVDLAAWAPGELKGLVLRNDKPLARESHLTALLDGGIDAAGRDSWQSVQIRTDAEGRFVLRTRQTTLRLQLSAGSAAGWQQLSFAETAFVPAAGHVEQTFHLSTGTLRVLLRDADDKPVAGVPLQLFDASGQQRHELPATDKTGCAEIEVEVEPFRVEVLPKRLLAEAAQAAVARAAPDDPDPFRRLRQRLGEVIVQQGVVTEQTLRLPPEWSR